MTEQKRKRKIEINITENIVDGSLMSFNIESVTGFPNHIILSQRFLLAAIDTVVSYFDRAISEGRMSATGSVETSRIIIPKVLPAMNN